MMLDWNAYQKEVLGRVADLGRLSPDIVRGYRQLSDAGKGKNVLGAKTRELIALAVAVTRQCDGCITIHTDAALKEGATRDEVAEALRGGHRRERRGNARFLGACDGCLRGESERVVTAKSA